MGEESLINSSDPLVNTLQAGQWTTPVARTVCGYRATALSKVTLENSFSVVSFMFASLAPLPQIHKILKRLGGFISIFNMRAQAANGHTGSRVNLKTFNALSPGFHV